MRISDWSSDVCSSDLRARRPAGVRGGRCDRRAPDRARVGITLDSVALNLFSGSVVQRAMSMRTAEWMLKQVQYDGKRSEEHTSELQSLMRISYAVFCLKKKNNTTKRVLDITE